MSEITDFYPSWLGTSGFGANGVRIRDIEPIIFRPTDISGCRMWFDGSDGSTINANEFGTVFSWENKGTLGGQFDLSGTQDVQWGFDFVNNLNVVSFSSNAFMSGSFALPFQERSVFFVSKEISVPANTANPWLSCDTSGGMEAFSLHNGTTTYFLGKHPSPVPELAFDTSANFVGYPALVEFINASDLSGNWMGINGIKYPAIYEAIASGYATGTQTLFLGGYFSGSTVPSVQQMCEIIVYEGALPESERVLVETYLINRWAIPISPPPAPFVPTDISGLYVWMDANTGVSVDLSNNVTSWSTLGTSAAVYAPGSNSVIAESGPNGNQALRFPSQATLESYVGLPYVSRTAFATFENLTDLTTITYPYINIIDTDASTGRQLGVAYDSNITSTTIAMCQQGQNCPVIGPIASLSTSGFQLAIWGSDSNTYLSSIGYFNGGSNINTSTDAPNLFNTNPIPYYVGSPVNDSPSFRIGEILEYDSLLTTAQISTVADYLVNKWAISSFTTIS